MVLLAAGNSSRFGENKLMYPIGGKPMFVHAVERAFLLQQEGLLDRVVLVTQYESVVQELDSQGYVAHCFGRKGSRETVAAAAGERGAAIEVVYNGQPELGISHSLQLGLQHLLGENGGSAAEACMFGVCDQPHLQAETMRKLIHLFQTSGKGMAACAAGDVIGNPVIFSKQYYPELFALEGDRGGKRVLRHHPEDVALLQTEQRELEDMDVRPIEEVFPFLADGERHVISLVGGGGKSTLMNDLADEFLRRGRTVVKTTTTHILQPEGEEFVQVQSLGLETLRARMDKGLPCTVGTPETKIDAEGRKIRKLTSLSPLLLASVIEAADVTIIEADGAKRLPMKAPANHEPVIHPATDIVIAVLGMRAMGQPLSRVCFRPEKAGAIIGAASQEHVVRPEDFAKLFLSEQGGRKHVGARAYYCVINQCDTEEELETAKAVAAQMPGLRVIASRHTEGERIFIDIGTA